MIEDCQKEIRAQFITRLPAALDVEDAAYAAADVAEFGAAIVLADPETYRLEEIGELRVQEFPAVLILARGGEERPIMTAECFLEHAIDVLVIVRETNPTRLWRRLVRTHEAVRRVLSQYVEDYTSSATNRIFQVDLVGWQYSPTYAVEGGGLERAVVQSIRVSELEARP